MTVGIVFSLIDPLQVVSGELALFDSREAVYTLSFLFFWLCYSAGCALSWYLARDIR